LHALFSALDLTNPVAIRLFLKRSIEHSVNSLTAVSRELFHLNCAKFTNTR
jgi:hypothetical protein